ncbi:GntR family transcriptional regulator [Lentibacillus daqui]|uniref:GntR family transcriptional regulator n=1 Tax=Lentibacillus daqui TaxID=2911514 RepID=UPI0022B09964|nr:GntR family transcriptional regulator [Lentibacillus daqui]
MDGKQSTPNISLSHIIAEEITHQIISGKLKPGEKVSEYDFAENFGTSRAPVREAIFLLTVEGLVERIPRKGAVVKGYTKEEIKDICEIRTILEDLAMKRIKAHGVDHEILKQIKNLISLMTMATEDQTEYTRLNQELHRCIIKMSQSNVINDMYWKLGRPLLALQRISFLEEKHIKKSLEEHKLIFELLSENSIDAANVILEKHNLDVITRIM